MQALRLSILEFFLYAKDNFNFLNISLQILFILCAKFSRPYVYSFCQICQALRFIPCFTSIGECRVRSKWMLPILPFSCSSGRFHFDFQICARTAKKWSILIRPQELLTAASLLLEDTRHSLIANSIGLRLEKTNSAYTEEILKSIHF